MADSPINQDQTAAASSARMAAATIIDNSNGVVGAGLASGINNFVAGVQNGVANLFSPLTKLARGVVGVPAGAQPLQPQAAVVNVKDSKGNLINQDLRVKIRVPTDYLVKNTVGGNGELSANKIGGIIFPYTPQISYEHKADYANLAPMHSNYTQYFYQRSSVGSFSITGKFTVQNEQDAAVYLATIHLLRALTKMRFGPDADRGAPPPVCRLDAYGDFMLANVPVAITSFKNDLPDGVDFFTIGKDKTSKYAPLYGLASVPTISTIAITCIPLYSREEQQKVSVNGWLNNNAIRKSGFL
jgi:hypothetical protein